MKSVHFMALDVHSEFCWAAWSGPDQRVHDLGQVPTRIPQLIAAIAQVPRPRILVMEEGPLSGWLNLNLRLEVEDLIVCDPRRNHLIADDGDKSDGIDTAKLLELARAGSLRRVHQAAGEGQLLLKQHIGLYHQMVQRRVRQANQVIWQLRRWGGWCGRVT